MVPIKKTVEQIWYKCETCGKSFYNEPNREKIGRGKYCSTECYFQNKKKMLFPNF